MLTDSYDNPYNLLGIPNNATQEEIRTAYITLAKRHHPDITSEENHEIMIRINAAYEKINTPEKKRNYDETHRFEINLRTHNDTSAATPPPGYTQNANTAYSHWQTYGNSAYTQYNPSANRTQPQTTTVESSSRGNVFTKMNQFNEKLAAIQASSFTADGSLMAIGAIDGTIQVRRVQTGELYSQFSLNRHLSGALLNVKIAANGATVGAWGYQMGMTIWNTQTRQEIRTISGEFYSNQTDFVMDSTSWLRLARPHLENKISGLEHPFWSGSVIQTIDLQKNAQYAAQNHICNESETDAFKGIIPEVRARFLAQDGSSLTTFSLLRNKQHGQTAGAMINQWCLIPSAYEKIFKPSILRHITFPGKIVSRPFAVSKSNNYAAIYFDQRALRIYNMNSGNFIDLDIEFLNDSSMVALSANGALAAIVKDSYTEIWSTQTRSRLHAWNTPSSVTNIGFTDYNGLSVFFIGRKDGMVEIWQTQKGI